jgi:aspartate aminotransferase
VVVSAGAKHALWNVAQVLYDPGDEVVIPTPCWVSYADQVQLCGATPVFVRCEKATGYLLTPEALARAVTPRTKAVVLCSPNNPTGAAYDAATLAALAQVIGARGLWAVCDEIYAELSYGGCEAPSLLKVAPELRERTVIVDGVSKSYAMTGFRLGWALAPAELARACDALQSQTTSSVSTVSQLAAIAALTRDQACVRKMRETYAKRRTRLVDGLRAIGGVSCELPSGAFYVFADVSAAFGKRSGGTLIEDDVDFTRLLLERERVAVVPGSAFHGPGHVRLSYAASLADLEEALARIASFMHGLT